MTTSHDTFKRVAIIGIGLIGSSLACALREYELAEEIVCGDANAAHVRQALELGIVDEATENNAEAVKGADLVILCAPVGSLGRIAGDIRDNLAKGCIVTDVGSVKKSVADEVAMALPEGTIFIPGHPIAGTEESGPDAGFAELFQGRWCILTPQANADASALSRLKAMWEGCGAKVEIMTPEQHDIVLAAVSHLPQLVSYSVVGAVAGLSKSRGQDFMNYSAGGFRDVTRIAASDPVMWRDIFMHNREAALEVIKAFSDNLSMMRDAVERGDKEMLEEAFAHAQKAKLGSLK